MFSGFATRHKKTLLTAAALAASALLLAGCSAGGDPKSKTIHVTLITKDPVDPFWVAMINGAKKEASAENAQITVASGKDQTDTEGQIQAIENAVTRGDDAILIANNGPAVNDAIKKAKDAGLLVVALDTPTTPGDLVDATFASDNLQAGEEIGSWTAGKLQGEKATIALLDLFGDKAVSIDYQRDQGFLKGMGIPLNNAEKNGDEAKTGQYSGGDYSIVCNEATDGAQDGGRTAMEKCLTLDPSINVVYTANEPSAAGAFQALKAAGNTKAIVVSINGSCDGIKQVASGELGADAQQYPSKMGADGVKAAVDFVRTGTKPTNPAGKDFTNTGITLVTDSPVDGVKSITSDEGSKECY
ncbi:substrate-binding domain-containing protein [Leifsonia aquatica]|uniref:substrate-binding domain-containing protein n=1 Tax=Leifsonia aquatica TaxID=144185 RepID=UPI003817F9E7